jgi:hypothetical protein
MTLTQRAADLFDEADAVPLSNAMPAVALLAGRIGDRFQLPLNLGFLDNVGLIDRGKSFHPDFERSSFRLLFATEVALDLPGCDGSALVLGSTAIGGSAVDLEIDIGPDVLTFRIIGSLALRFSPEILKPARYTAAGWEEIPDARSEIRAALILAVDRNGEVSFTGPSSFSLPPALVGGSGVVIQADSVTPVFSDQALPQHRSGEIGPGWRGVFIASAKVYLPGGLSPQPTDPPSNVLPPSDLTFENCYLGNGGFTGDVTKTWVGPAAERSLFGMDFTLKSVHLGFRQSIPVATEIIGEVSFPSFDKPVDVEIGIGLDGTLLVGLSKKGGKHFSKAGVLDMELDSIAFEFKDGLFRARLRGKLTPLFGADQGLKWPAFDVKELAIDSKGNIHLDGGWLDLPKQYTLNLHGFKLEISKLGFGKTEDGGKFIGFSGGLKLVDGMPAGASVEGLRIVWYPDGRKSLTLKGVGVEFTVPEVLHFKGEVSYEEKEKRFTGDIKLELATPELTIDGTLVIGTANGAQGKYTYFAIYLDADLPGGIVLGNTGLSIYGMAGLFALQMEPDKKPDDKWFSLDHDHSWYHHGERGVTDIVNKWRPRKGSVALGAGLTLATTVDNGYSFNGQFMLVLVFPGPIIMLQGSANLLKKRSEAKEDALFRALAVFDGRESTVLIGLDAEYKTGKQGQMIEIQAGAEAFYSFNDPSAWYLNLGKDEPRSQRIRALFGRFVEVDAYFMLNAHRLALGAWYGLNRTWNPGPLTITLQAWADGNVLVSFKPSQFHGDLRIHGEVGLDVFGFGLSLTLDAQIAADLFTPFHLLGIFSVKVELPWPLPDVEASVTLEWGIRPDPPPIPLPLQNVSIEHLKSTAAWPLQRGELLLANNADADGFVIDVPVLPGEPVPSVAIPVVPVDARPHLTFARSMHDFAKVGVNGQEPAEWETIGDPSRGGQAEARYSLQGVVLAKKVMGIWTSVASAPTSGTDLPLFGSWAALPAIPGGDSSKSAQTKLWLWNLDPFAFLRRSGTSWEDWFAASFPGYPCVPELPAQEACFGFDALAPGSTVESPWTHPGAPEVTLSWDFGPATVRTRTITVGGVTRRVNLLCFPDAAARSGVRIRSVKPSRSFRVLLADPPQSAPAAAGLALAVPVIATIDSVPTCIDMRARTAGTIANPWSENGVRFTVRGADGERLPIGRIERWGKGSLGFNAGFGLDIDLPCPSSSVELLVTHRPPFRIVAFNAKGTAVATHAPQGTGGEVTETIRLEGPAITRLEVHASGNEKLVHRVCFVCVPRTGPSGEGHGADDTVYGPFYPDTVGDLLISGPELTVGEITSNGAFCLERICVTPDIEAGALVRRLEKIDHIRDVLSLWSDKAPVLEPNTDYRLEISTTAELKGGKAWALHENAYFRTEGPPGLTHLAIPKGTDTDPSKPFVTGLEDLTRYVHKTDPPTVPPPGEKPLLFRPFYRAYDLGVEFNESYVDTMYRMDRRDLGFYLFTASNQPARDSKGKLLALTNHWGKTEALTLSESETRWLKLIDAATCLPKKPDPRTFPHDNTLTATEPDRVLAPDTLYEARLVPLLLHETFVGVKPGDPPVGWYAEDAGPGGPSRWRVMEVGTPPTRYVEQTAKIGSAVEPDRPGTVLLLADPTSADWTDVRVSVYVRSVAGGAAGLVVRHGGPGSGYRFALHERLRRLVKATPTGVKILAEDHFAWQRNRDYLLTVEAIGKSLRAYIDGEPVFAVEDADFAIGRIGLYACRSPEVRFSDVRVDDFRAGAPVVYRFQLATSLYANFYHHLHGFEDETWPGAALGADAAAPLALAVAPSFDPPEEAEARAYEDLAKLALGAAPALQRSTRIEATRLTRSGGGPILLLRSPEPLPPQRVELALSRPSFGLTTPARPRDLKLTDVAFGALRPAEESVTLLLREAGSLTRHRIELRELPGPVAEPAGDPFLLLESFVSAGALARFEVVDQGTDGGPSQWQVEGGALIQTSAIRGGSQPALPGTQAVTGHPSWTDHRLSARLRSDAGGSVGLVFRWVDADNHYRLSADATRRFRRLVKVENGAVTILREDAGRYTPGEPFRLEVEAVGARLTAYLDGVRLFTATDAAHPAGRVGLYAADDPTARCEQLEVRLPSLEGQALLVDAFAAGDLTGWALLSEVTGVPLGQAAAWETAGGALRLRSLLAQGGDPDYPGVLAVADEPLWSDGIFQVRLRSQGGAIGVVFRGQDLANYYRFSMSRQRGVRQLIKKVGGVAQVLWQDDVLYEADRPYELTVAAVGTFLRGWIDGIPLFAVEDGSLAFGRTSLYAWSNPEAWFSGVRLWPAGRAFSGWWMDEGFAASAPERWSFLAEDGEPDLVPWTIGGGTLRAELDPASWEAPEGGADNVVRALALAGGDLYVGGQLTHAGGDPASRIAAWSGGAWKALGAGVDGPVRALAADGDRLYVGGLFATAGGAPARHVAVWDRATGTWSALGNGTDGPVFALAVIGGQLYAGGQFTTAGGVAASNLAVWDRDTGTWSAVGGGVDAPVLALAARGGRLYVGGRFSQAGGQPASRIALWNGGSWAAASSALDGPVSAIVEGAGGLFIGGGFTNAGGAAVSRIARWTGSAWAPLGAGVNGPVDALALDGNQLWVAGRFTQAGGAPASRIARWSLTARAWSPVEEGLSDAVFALASAGDRLWAGGSFTAAATAPAPRVAALRLGRSRFALARAAAPDDFRLTVRLVPGPDGAAAVVPRFVDAGHHLALWLDAERGLRRLVRTEGGAEEVLWGDAVRPIAGREHAVTLDAVGDRITGYVDGVLLFDLAVSRGALARSQVGVAVRRSPEARFREVRLAEPGWTVWHAFGEEEGLLAGTRIRVHGAPPAPVIPREPGVVLRTVTRAGESGSLSLAARGTELRLVAPDGTPGHARAFLGPKAYAPVAATVIRKADGTGLFLLPAGDAGAGPLRLQLTYHRDREEAGRAFRQAGDDRPERVMLDIP